MAFPFDLRYDNVTYMIMDVKYIKSKNVQELSLPIKLLFVKSGQNLCFYCIVKNLSSSYNFPK